MRTFLSPGRGEAKSNLLKRCLYLCLPEVAFHSPSEQLVFLRKPGRRCIVTSQVITSYGGRIDEGGEEDRGSEIAVEGEKSQGPADTAPRRGPIGPAMPSAAVLAQAQQAAAEFALQVRRSRYRFFSHRCPLVTRGGTCLCEGVRTFYNDGNATIRRR